MEMIMKECTCRKKALILDGYICGDPECPVVQRINTQVRETYSNLFTPTLLIKDRHERSGYKCEIYKIFTTVNATYMVIR